MESLNRIALIDDDPICHLISSKMIKKFSDMKVESYTDAREALFQLKWRAENELTIFPEVILLDIDMPVMTGWQFLDEFQHLPEVALNKTNVIILSSSSHHTDVRKSKEYSIVKDFFSKPLTEEKVKMISQLEVSTKKKDQ